MPSVVLVEGNSDRIALETLLAARRTTSRVVITPTNGAGGIKAGISEARHRYGESVRLSGMYDIGELEAVGRALTTSGVTATGDRQHLESVGFFACDPDLEGELIRGAGVEAVIAIIASSGEARSLESLRNQPAWRGMPPADQLRRFMGSQSGRKARYARLLVEQLDPERVPQPLSAVLRHAIG